MGQTEIEWTDKTWNPLVGCAMVSPGCANCYAETMSRRLAGMAKADIAAGRNPGRKGHYPLVVNQRGRWNGHVKLVPEALMDPIKWRGAKRVFVNSMSDLFHDEVPFGYIDKVFAVMAMTPQHTYQILTKRPERMRYYTLSRMTRGRIDMPQLGWKVERLLGEWATGPLWRHWEACHAAIERTDFTRPLPNVWLGTSTENQATADKRIHYLLQCPAAVRFLSVEPMLGGIDLRDFLKHPAMPDRIVKPGSSPVEYQTVVGIDWVIVGGESGPGARPMHPDWVRMIRDQCQAAGVAFFFKQWGAFCPYGLDYPLPVSVKKGMAWVSLDGKYSFETNPLEPAWLMSQVGKHAAGRLLDGREWNEMPFDGASLRSEGGAA